MPSGSFLARFTEWVDAAPQAPALSWGDRVVSYAELSRLADTMRAMVDRLDAEPEAPVCVPAKKSPETIALLIACLRAGKQILLPPAELGAEALVELSAQAGCSHLLSARGSVRVIGNAGRGMRPGESGLLLTTSGSTGLPKTVVLSASGVDRFLAWSAASFGIEPGTTVLSFAPLNFDLSLLDIWATLAAGALVELVDQDRAASGAYLLDVCTRSAPTVIQAVPMFYRLLDGAHRDGRRFDSVAHAIFTGDAMPLRLLERMPELFPSAKLWNVYGSTETNDSFLHEVTVDEARALGAVPIGRPIPGVDALIVDESGSVVSGPGTGELFTSTPFQAVGYLDPVRTKEKWRLGYFRTGDLVRRDADGLVFLLGRDDHQVKVRGVRTNLQEIEQVILRHTDVLEAAVVTIADEIAGNRLHAVVRRQPYAELNSIQLRVHCAAKLPRTAVPSTVEIVDQALPRTSTGKVDRKSLTVLRERTRHVD